MVSAKSGEIFQDQVAPLLTCHMIIIMINGGEIFPARAQVACVHSLSYMSQD